MRIPMMLVLIAGLVATGPIAPARAELIDESNLMENEGFWPYQVRLVHDVKIDDKTFAAGSPGVLIRLEQGNLARIDFGRRGIHDVPVAYTNIVERAREHASGKREKLGDNFVVAVGPRMVEPDPAQPRPWDIQAAVANRAYLCIFADPASPDFEKLAQGVAKLTQGREGLATFFFPQNTRDDVLVMQRLVASDWKVPFMMGRMSGLYTETLIEDSLARPAVVLNTPAGRVLFEAPWSTESRSELEALLDARFGRRDSTEQSAALAPTRAR